MIGIMGNEFFGKRIVKALSGKANVIFLYSSLDDLSFIKKIKNVRVIHFIGSPTVSTHGVLTLLRLKMAKKKIIVHWVGADSWLANKKFHLKVYSQLLKNKIELHIAIEKEIARKLESLGIKSITYPLPVATHYNLEPLPSKKQILVYAPDEEEYYWKRFNGDLIKRIVREFPEVTFIILRNSGKYFSEQNVKCFKWVENMKKMYQESLGMIRISEHDGFPGTMVEALSMGRHFVYSQEFPYCKKATNFEELKKAIEEIINEPKLNIDGKNYIEKEYGLDKIAKGLVDIYKKYGFIE